MAGKVTVSVYSEQLNDGGFEVGCYLFDSRVEAERIVADAIASYHDSGQVIVQVQHGTTFDFWTMGSNGEPEINYSTSWSYTKENFGCE